MGWGGVGWGGEKQQVGCKSVCVALRKRLLMICKRKVGKGKACMQGSRKEAKRSKRENVALKEDIYVIGMED